MWQLLAKNIYPLLGWTGTFSYLLAYLLLSIGKLKANQLAYHILNIIGAVGLTANAVYYADLPNVVVNLAWGCIALVAIIVLSRKKKPD